MAKSVKPGKPQRLTGKIQWVFYRMVGIEIEDQDDWQNFMFEDATLVNAKQLFDYLDLLPERTSPFDNDIVQRREYRENETILVVKSYAGTKSQLEDAENRSIEVAAFVFFCFLFKSANRFGISRKKEVFDSTVHQVAIASRFGMSGEHCSPSFDALSISVPEPPFKYRREILLSIFGEPLFDPIFQRICSKKSAKEKNSFLTIFYLASNSSSASAQLVGCVTAIEAILKTAGKDGVHQERLRSLLRMSGIAERDFFCSISKEIFKRRNDFVHEGKVCHRDYAAPAISLTTIVFLLYCQYRTHYKSREEFFKVLDAVGSFIESKDSLPTFRKPIGDLILSEKIRAFLDSELYELIRFYSLNDPNPTNCETMKFAVVVYLLRELRTLSVAESFELLKSACFYHDCPFSTVEVLESYYSNNKESLEISVRSYSNSWTAKMCAERRGV